LPERNLHIFSVKRLSVQAKLELAIMPQVDLEPA